MVSDEWSLDFNIDGEPVTIMCRSDPGARVWDGKESFDVFLPYYVSSDEGEFAPESHPFNWTKTADDILTKAKRLASSGTGH